MPPTCRRAPGSGRLATALVTLHALVFVCAPPSASAAGAARPSVPAIARPLAFEPNRGQGDPRAELLGRAPGMSVALAAPRIELAAGGSRLGLRLMGARRGARFAPQDELPGRVSYLHGRDPAGWKTGLPTYARARAAAVYPRIDLVVYGTGSGLEYDFEVAPRADPRVIRLRITGSATVRLERDGSLTLASQEQSAGLLRQRAPFAYQELDGVRQPVAVRFARRGRGEFGFALGAYDRTRALVIDPAVEYTLLTCAVAGGPGGDSSANGIAVDPAGNVYVAGSTRSPVFPTLNPRQAALAGLSDGFVMKLDPSGQKLLYATYFGGSLDDFASSIAVTPAGEAIVGGRTLSLSDFPVQSAYQPVYAGGTVDGDGFVFKLDAAGSGLVFSTFLGGAGEDRVNGVAADTAGNAYAAGTTTSMNFPIASALQGSCSNGCAQSDGFVAKFGPAGAINYATYLGGSGAEQALAIGADAAGLAYVAGGTTSGDFPFTAGALQTANAGGEDAFLAIYKADGSGLTGATYLGGTLDDRATSVAPDGAGNAYLGGWTDSGDFPLFRSIQGVNAGMRDGFLSELDAAAGGFVNISDYLGGSDDDAVNGVALGPGGTLYLVGSSRSLYLPFSYAFQPFRTGGVLAEDAFVAMFEPVGPGIQWGSFLGGLGPDSAYAVATGADGRAWFAGLDDAADFPERGRQYKTGAFRNDAFIASAGVGFAVVSAQALLPTVSTGKPIDMSYTIRNVSLVAVTALTAILDLGASCLDTSGVSPASVIADAPVTVTWTPPVLRVAFTNPFALDEYHSFAVSGVNAGPAHTARCDVPSQFVHQSDQDGLTALVTFQIDGCAALPQPVTGLKCVRQASDIALQWDPASDAATQSYDVWKQLDGYKRRIPDTNLPNSFQQLGQIQLIAAPGLSATPNAADLGAFAAPNLALVFYQVRGVCADGTEGTDHPF